LVNLGTPDAPTPAAVRRYLAEFLSDPRVIEIPRAIWWPILHGVILQVRPKKSARAYSSIWTEEGSPLMVYTRRLGAKLQQELNSRAGAPVTVEIAMRYGKPSLAETMQRLRAEGVERFVVLPLYPQYAAASSGSVFDALALACTNWRFVPDLRFISHYHDHPAYVGAVADSIRRFWDREGRGRYLLMSLHGLPERTRQQGDPYYDQCQTSGRAIARALGLGETDWELVFQSRFGAERWLQPYCVEVLKQLPARGIAEVDVVCPGFAVDCLETLEEIGIANKEVFLKAGGTQYRLIPCLNDSPEHAAALADILVDRCGPLRG
jgi:ferrochelatase